MGFGFHGKIADRLNKALLKKRNLKTKDDVYGIQNITKLHFKKSTRRDIARVKKMMFIQKQKENRATFWALVITILLVIISYLFLR